ncbi:hypothetical protein [Rhizobium sp. 57MFTsu3.2]|uniref:hypothetical protein n=1 Tax=Rhizobium sp. 57MFTsu3.2 TaxID=1048681 RepID=UPI00146C9FAA|nr:hypothetical protein [Rhizobium sp. 57MFTsu3.2]NMN71169.1 hypothetical protein [Rhizobium sp. 57MFTsu3.2]
MADEKDYPAVLGAKAFSENLTDRYNSLKYVSDYAGALTRLAFLIAAINVIWIRLVWSEGVFENHTWIWYVGLVAAAFLSLLALALALSMVSLSWAILSDWLIGKPPKVPHNSCVRKFAVGALTTLLAVLVLSVSACLFALFIYQAQKIS